MTRLAVRTLVATVALLALMTLSFLPLHSTPAARPASLTPLSGASPLAGGGLDANVLWNGVPTAPASSPSSAIGTSFGNLVTLWFSWGWTAGSLLPAVPGYGIAHAQLRVLYLGQSVWMKDLQLEPPRDATFGAVNLTSDLTSSQYLLEGVYLVEADLVSDNRGQVWSEQFYVHVTAPNHLTAANLGLGALAVYEVVQLARVGPHALPKERMTTKVEPEKPSKGAP
jgi:hypothetical protein